LLISKYFAKWVKGKGCAIPISFLPTYSYMFFQWKTFQICPQDLPILYSTKLPPDWKTSVPAFQWKEDFPSIKIHSGNLSRLWIRKNDFLLIKIRFGVQSRFDEAKLRVSRIQHLFLNFVRIYSNSLSNPKLANTSSLASLSGFPFEINK
jgi:hypothetical protein